MSNTSEKLLAKIKQQFPEISMPIDENNQRLIRVNGLNGTGINKWTNLGIDPKTIVFSREPMSKCLKKKIKAKNHSELGSLGIYGWEIYTV